MRCRPPGWGNTNGKQGQEGEGQHYCDGQDGSSEELCDVEGAAGRREAWCVVVESLELRISFSDTMFVMTDR